MYSLMSIWMSASRSPNMNSASVLREEGLADAGRAEENERADRAARILEIRARAAQRLADGDDRFVLADDACPSAPLPS